MHCLFTECILICCLLQSLKYNESWKNGDFRLTKKVYKVGSKQRDTNQSNDVRWLVMSWLPLHFSPFCCSAQLWLECLDQTTALISLQMCSQMALSLTCQCVIYLELAEFRPDVLGSSAAQNEPSQQPHFWWVWCCIKKTSKISNSVANNRQISDWNKQITHINCLLVAVIEAIYFVWVVRSSTE